METRKKKWSFWDEGEGYNEDQHGNKHWDVSKQVVQSHLNKLETVVIVKVK